MQSSRLESVLCLLVLTAPLLAFTAAPAAALPSPVADPGYTTFSYTDQQTFLVESAATPGGDVAFAWIQTNATYVQSVWARWHTVASGWGPPIQLKFPAGAVSNLQVVIDGAGDAFVLWSEYFDAAIWYSAVSPGAFTGPYQVRNVTVNPGVAPVLAALDTSGIAVVWVEGGGASATTWVATLGAIVPVVGPRALDTQSLGITAVALAAGTKGTATALWCGSDGSNATLLRSDYARETGWSASAVALRAFAPWCGRLAAGSDARGDMTAVLEYTNATGHFVGWMEFTYPGTWSAPAAIQGVIDRVTRLAFQEDAAGYGLVVWNDVESGVGPSFTSVYAAALDGGSGAFAALTLDFELQDRTPGWAFALTPGGGALVVIGGNVGVYQFQTYEFTRSSSCTGWSGPQLAGIIDATLQWPTLALGADGSGLVGYPAREGPTIVARSSPIAYLEAPSLVVDFPAPYASVDYPVAIVTGISQPGVTVYADTVYAQARAAGDFVLAVPLVDGDNLITLGATFLAPWDGCAASATIRVHYNDPLVPLLAELAAAQAGLAEAGARANATAAEANVTKASLDAAEANLTAAQTRMDALAADANATQADLSASQADLAAAQSRVAALELNASASSAERDAARTNLTAAQTRLTTLESSLASTQTALADTQAQLTAARSDMNATKSQTSPASGDSSLGALLGLAGIGVGGLGVAMAARAGRAKKGESVAAPPDAEPPKPPR